MPRHMLHKQVSEDDARPGTTEIVIKAHESRST